MCRKQKIEAEVYYSSATTRAQTINLPIQILENAFKGKKQKVEIIPRIRNNLSWRVVKSNQRIKLSQYKQKEGPKIFEFWENVAAPTQS